MSRLVRNKPEIHKTYVDCYRAIRLNKFNRYIRQAGVTLARCPEHQSAVLKAFISYDNKSLEFGGWCNPTRKAKFEWAKHMKLYPGDIPF